MADPRIVLSAVDKTKAAFDSAKRNLDGLMKTADGLGAKFGTIGVAITGALTGASLQGAIDAADQLGKLSQRSGIAVEDLSVLRYAGKLADVSMEELGDSTKKLNLNIAAAARGEREQAEAFKTLGVSVTDANGKIRGTFEILGDVAEKFSGYEDGANKVALANAIGGKSFEKLIPLLNGGRQGLLDAREELEKFGGVIGQDLAGKAERFNDNLTKIEARLEAAKLAIADGLLPELVSLGDAFVTAESSGEGLVRVLDQLADKGQDFLGKLAGKAVNLLLRPESVEQLSARAAIVKYQIENIQEALQKDPGQPVLVRRLAELQAQLEEFDSKARAAERALVVGGGRGLVNPPNVIPADPKKKDAPALSSSSGGTVDQVQLLRTQLQKREQLIQASLSNEQDIIRFTERFIQEVYRSGTVSLEATFQAEAELRRRNVEEVRRASEETIRAEQEFQAKLPKPRNAQERQRNQVEVEGSEAKIAEARRKVAAADRDAQQQAAIAEVQNNDRRQKLRQEVESFEAAIKDLTDGGRTRAGELAEIAVKVKAAQELLIQSGVPEADAAAQAQRLGAVLEQQRQFNLARDEFARITDRARDAEEALLLVQEKQGTGLAEGQREVYELRKQQLTKLDALIDKTRELARVAAERNGGVVPDNIADDLRRIELQRQRLAQNLDPQRLRANQSADNIGDAIANGLERAIVQGEKLSDVLDGIGREIVAIVTRETITEPLAKSISSLIKGGFQDGGGNILQQFFGGIFGRGTTPLGEVGGIPVGGLAGTAAGAASQAATQAAAQAPVITAITTASATETTAITTAITASSTAQISSITSQMAADGGYASAIVGAIGASTAAIVGALGALATANGLSGVGSLVNGGFSSLGGVGFGGSDGVGFIFHEGGVSGQGGERRTFSLDVFDQAVRYHTGGIGGHPADVAIAAPIEAPAGTVAAVLQVGEEVIAPTDPRHRDNLASKAYSAAEVIARGSIVAPGPSVPGLASDEVPAFLPRGWEVLTADDPRHADNLPAGSVMSGDAITSSVVNNWWDDKPRFHSGGVVGRVSSSLSSSVPNVGVALKVEHKVVNNAPVRVRTEQQGNNTVTIIDQIEDALGQRINNGGGLLGPINRRNGSNGSAGLVV